MPAVYSSDRTTTIRFRPRDLEAIDRIREARYPSGVSLGQVIRDAIALADPAREARDAAIAPDR